MTFLHILQKSHRFTKGGYLQKTHIFTDFYNHKRTIKEQNIHSVDFVTITLKLTSHVYLFSLISR